MGLVVNWKHFVRLNNENYKARSQQMTSQKKSWTLGICGSSPVQFQLIVDILQSLQSHVSKPIICSGVTGSKKIQLWFFYRQFTKESSFYTLTANKLFIRIVLLNSWIVPKIWCNKLLSLFVFWEFSRLITTFQIPDAVIEVCKYNMQTNFSL